MYEKRLEPDEPCFVISVAAQMVGLHPQTLRYYERAGLVQPRRSRGNIRLYSQRDIEDLRRIARLTDELGVNLAAVEVILNLTRRMEEMQGEMDRMEEKLEEERERLRRGE
ncbi:MAG: helix-turn-helix transcriptional regulator [Chloroflexi bacterium]|nr:helix-turn-helix transcriptional regulator [Chloroflexota bacterium]